MTIERQGYQPQMMGFADLIYSGELVHPDDNKTVARINAKAAEGKAVVMAKGQVIGARLMTRGWLTDIAHQIAIRHGQTEQFAEQHMSPQTAARLAYLTDACVEANRRDISSLGR